MIVQVRKSVLKSQRFMIWFFFATDFKAWIIKGRGSVEQLAVVPPVEFGSPSAFVLKTQIAKLGKRQERVTPIKSHSFLVSASSEPQAHSW